VSARRTLASTRTCKEGVFARPYARRGAACRRDDGRAADGATERTATDVGLAFVGDHLSTIHALRADGRTACGLRASQQVRWFVDGRPCGRCRRVLAAAQSDRGQAASSPSAQRGAA
jgi:hypothetical protein